MKPFHTGLPFFLYRMAWFMSLPAVRLLSAADESWKRVSGRGFLPPGWRVGERLGYPAGNARAPGSGSGRSLWLHCASLGESKGLWALVLELREADDVLVSATTADGMDYLADRCAAFGRAHGSGADGGFPSRRIRAVMAPLDHPGLVRRFLERHRVLGLCLYESELWPNYLAACREKGLPAALVSGRMTEKALRRYRLLGGGDGAFAVMARGLAFVEAQGPADAVRIAALLGNSGAAGKLVTGFDYKAAHYLRAGSRASGFGDSAGGNNRGVKPRPARSGTARGRIAFLSLHLPELHWFRETLPGLMQRFDVSVFPRRMSEVGAFRNILEPMGFSLHGRDPGGRHLLVDSLGKIEGLLPACASAFVGGSLVAAGCHNLWEPLLCGSKIRFGPNYQGQASLARMLLDRNIAEVVRDKAQVERWEPPGPEIPAAAALLAEDLRTELDSALDECRRRIIATFYGNDGPSATLSERAADIRNQG